MASRRRPKTPRSVPQAIQLPPQELSPGTYSTAIGEATVNSGIPPPVRRGFKTDLFWLLDNVLKVDQSLDIGRACSATRIACALYARTRSLPRGTFRVRELKPGWSRIWRMK